MGAMEAQDGIPNALGPNNIQAVKQALDLALERAGAELLLEDENGGARVKLVNKEVICWSQSRRCMVAKGRSELNSRAATFCLFKSPETFNWR